MLTIISAISIAECSRFRMLGTTLDLLAAAAHGRGVELACEIAPDVPARLRGDSGRLRQILINLVGNAIKFTEKGEVVLRVNIASRTTTHATVRFDIEDTGIGISPAAQGTPSVSQNQTLVIRWNWNFGCAANCHFANYGIALCSILGATCPVVYIRSL